MRKNYIVHIIASSNIRKYLQIFHSFNIRSMRVLDLWPGPEIDGQ